MFGIIFDGHPALTRILMPDDWPGHPQRKDYPLGGVPVEYKGATIPPQTKGGRTREHDRRAHPGPAAARRRTYGAAADAAEGRVYTVTGQDWDSSCPSRPSAATSASWSTWVHSTLPRTVCSG